MKKDNQKKHRTYRFPFKSIRTGILVPFSLLMIATVLIFSAISLNYTEKAVLSNSIDYTSRLIDQVNRDIDSYINYMESISNLMVENSDVEKYLFGQSDEDERRRLRQRIIAQFNTVVETRGDIANIAIVSPTGESIINDGKDSLNHNISLEEVDWYRDIKETKGNVLTASHVQNVIQNNYKWVVTLGRGINNPRKTEEGGIFFIDLNYKIIKDLCENNNVGMDSYIFIMDNTGKIIYHPSQQLIYSGLKQEKTKEVLACKEDYFLTKEGEDSKLYTISRSEKTGWSVVGVARTAKLMEQREETKRLYLMTAAILLFIAAGMTVFLSYAITNPIKRLKLAMEEVEQGGFGKPVEVDLEDVAGDEIGSLGNSFNHMTARIGELMEQNTYEQEQKRISELKALQSQINPHFLYNTLDSIIWMAESGKNQEVVLMTASLARLLRKSISNDNEIVTIKHEIDYTENYLTIQKMRYRDKLEFRIDVEEAVLQQNIIKLVLQPLVENAIYHGIKYKEEKGLIHIKGYLDEEDIILEVYDNGAGMTEEELAHIFEQGEEPESGVGVHNVQTRLKLYYGEAYGLSYESEPQKGTKATIRIPMSTQKGAEDEA